MNIFTSMAEKIKTGIRTWLHIQPAVNGSISIQETLDYEGNAIKNKIWYRGESEELSQLYSQWENAVPATRQKCYSVRIHSGMHRFTSPLR